MNWDDIRIFLEVVRCGTLSSAGMALGMDQTTISRRLKRFEASIGVPMFEISGSQRHLTAAGHDMWLEACSIEQAAASLLAAGKRRQTQPHGHVRLAASRIVSRLYLLPYLPELQAACPGITLDLVVSDELADLSRLEVDLAVRLTVPETGNLIVRRIGAIAFDAYVHKDAGANVGFAGLSGRLKALPEAHQIAEALGSETAFFQTNDADLFIDAVRSGAVKAYIPEAVAALYADLVPVPGTPSIHRKIWLVTRRDMNGSGAVRAVKTWIETCFGDPRQDRLPR